MNPKFKHFLEISGHVGMKVLDATGAVLNFALNMALAGMDPDSRSNNPYKDPLAGLDGGGAYERLGKDIDDYKGKSMPSHHEVKDRMSRLRQVSDRALEQHKALKL